MFLNVYHILLLFSASGSSNDKPSDGGGSDPAGGGSGAGASSSTAVTSKAEAVNAIANAVSVIARRTRSNPPSTSNDNSRASGIPSARYVLY